LARRAEKPEGANDMMRITAGTMLLAATLAAGALMQPTSAPATSKFDGNWSVIVFTTSGPCDPSYRISGAIINGAFSYAYNSLEMTGHVEESGATSVSVIYGTARATAHGRLSANHGSGTWSGSGPDGRCAGTWIAMRAG
jgi:hypothetical protein